MLSYNNVTIQSGPFELNEVNLEIAKGAYAVLMGPTGCGKTTLLEALCGLRTVTEGQITLEGQDITHLPPGKRGIGYVPQDGALFDTYSVAQNLGFALMVRKLPATEIKLITEELASKLSISHLLTRSIQGLSGGERQRVALGRALAHKPNLLLMDEPLSALDEETHGEMCTLLENLSRQEQLTVLHVTHSQSEARRLGDIHFKMRNGKILTPTEDPA